MAKKKRGSVDEWNARVLAEHAKIVDQILVLRPDWDRAKLLAVGKTWGSDADSPGLLFIQQTLQHAAAFAEKFKA
jgi:hypothetical protein